VNEDLYVNYLEAALEVLSDRDRPMTSREIINEAKRRGLIKPSGQTPHRSLEKSLYADAGRGKMALVERVFEPGRQRAVKGSVRWRTLKGAQAPARRS
jgi:hypothetical protein